MKREVVDVINFGKYKGKKIDDLLLENPKYLHWVYTQVENDERKYVNMRYKLASASGHIRFPFGKYKHKTIKHVYSEDRSYFLWCMKNFKDGDFKDYMKSFLKFLKTPPKILTYNKNQAYDSDDDYDTLSMSDDYEFDPEA